MRVIVGEVTYVVTTFTEYSLAEVKFQSENEIHTVEVSVSDGFSFTAEALEYLVDFFDVNLFDSGREIDFRNYFHGLTFKSIKTEK